MTKQSIIQLNHICAAYERKKVLEDINLTVYEKDFLGVIGPNGGGKTTLIKIILGLLHPISGDVVLSGLNRQKALLRSFTAQQHEQVKNVIARMGLEGLEKRAIGELSGGQLQRALLGRALVSDPQVVILDEPNTYIDKRFEAKLYSLLEEINKERAIILVSHDIGTVLQNVKSIACVNGTLDYHPDTEIPAEWLEEHFGCPIELLGHGDLPHRVLKCHHHD